MNEFIKWEDIDHKNKNSGTAKLKCPTAICSNRVKKTDRALYVHYGDGIAKCFHCGALSFRDSVEVKTQKTYKLPSQEWKNYTNLSDPLVKYIEERGIKQYTANKLGWTEEVFWQGAIQKNVKNLVFNYFEGETLVSKKYRDRNKNFMQSKDCKNILYNINSLIGAEEAYITEGEFDVAAILQIGIENVVSVPNGANNKDDYWINSEPYLRGIKKFYICTDMDEKGEELAELIAHRLGRYKCERVLFYGKDANDDLKNGVLEESIKVTKGYPVSGTHTVESLHSQILTLHENGLPPVIYPKNPCFEGMRKVFSLMMGHLCVCTGIPSHGKSNFTEWYILNLVAENNYKASFFSPEHHPLELHQSTFIEKFTGKNFFLKYNEYGERDEENGVKVDVVDIAKYVQWANERIYLTSPEDNINASWDWIFERFQEQVYKYGINIFIIDAWNKVEFNAGDRGSTLEKTNNALSRLSSFAQKNNVLVVLIAHPTKMQKDKDTGIYDIPDLYNVSGSADFRNQTHDGYCIYRFFKNESLEDEETNPNNSNFTRFINLKTKMKFQGEMMAYIDFEYHIPSGRYYKKDCEPDLDYLVDVRADGTIKAKWSDLINDKHIVNKIVPIPLIEPSEAFKDIDYGIIDTDSDVPF